MAPQRHSHLAESVQTFHKAEGRLHFFCTQLMGRHGEIQSLAAIGRIKDEQLIEYSLSPLFATPAWPKHLQLLPPGASAMSRESYLLANSPGTACSTGSARCTVRTDGDASDDGRLPLTRTGYKGRLACRHGQDLVL
jgi:hypothetical protein